MKRPQPPVPSPASSHSWRAERLVPSALLLLAAVPVLGGVYRVAQLTLGADVTPANQRFFDAPVPIVLHGLACIAFACSGALQFAPGARSRNPRAHRVRGLIFVPSALVVALTGLWMQARYELPSHDGPLLALFRVVFGTAMVGTTIAGVAALLRRAYAAHGAWMMRTYAIGMGAGTQVLVYLPWLLVFGEPDVQERAWLMGAGWGINLVFVEWVLRRGGREEPSLPQGAVS